MSDVAQYAVRDGVAVITMNNPPVNGLGNALRAALLENLKKADADAAVKAAVLIGSAKAFSGGADIREFGKPREKPDLPDVNDFQDSMRKPLVGTLVDRNPVGHDKSVAHAAHSQRPALIQPEQVGSGRFIFDNQHDVLHPAAKPLGD